MKNTVGKMENTPKPKKSGDQYQRRAANQGTVGRKMSGRIFAGYEYQGPLPGGSLMPVLSARSDTTASATQMMPVLRVMFATFVVTGRERRLTTPSSETAEGWHDCCAVGSAGSSRHDRPELFSAALG